MALPTAVLSSSSSNQLPPAPAAGKGKPRLLALTQRGCPACATWKVPILQLAVRRPDLSVEIIDCDDEPERWSKTGAVWVSETPTFKVVHRDGTPGCSLPGRWFQLGDGQQLEGWVDRVLPVRQMSSCPRHPPAAGSTGAAGTPQQPHRT